MQINFSYDASVSTDPNASELEAALNYAASVLDKLITNPITVTIAVGWNEVEGQALGAGDLAEGGPVYGYDLTYAALVSELELNDTSLVAREELAHLSVTGPGPDSTYFVSSAQAKAWGIEPPAQTGTDGAIGFSSAFNYTYDPNNRAVPGEYDIIGIAEHEITHALGRITGDGAFDISDYSAPGVNTVAGKSGYFSVDGGVTDLGNYANQGDTADWFYPGYPGDAFNYVSSPGTENNVTYHDDQLLSALGFNINGLAQPTVTTVSTPATFRSVNSGDYTLVGKGDSIGFFGCNYASVLAASASEKVISSGTTGLTVTDGAAGLALCVQGQVTNLTVIDWKNDAQLYLWPLKSAAAPVITSDGSGGDYLSGFVASNGAASSIHFVNGVITAAQIHNMG